MRNCIVCEALCKHAGENVCIADCDKFDPVRSAVIYTDTIKGFPKRIVVKAENGREVEYAPLPR